VVEVTDIEFMSDPTRHCGPKSLGTDPDIFFSTDDIEQAVAKRVCRRCPVQQACVRYALDAGEGYGVWGGYLMSSAVEKKAARAGRKLTSRRKPRLVTA
jgi:WhiB family redox-sensing transcriptional regulator